MKWSYRIGEWFGIGVDVHLTFGLLLAWIGIGTLISSGSVPASLVSVAFVLALFAFVLLHEYGHALTARYYGIQTRQITLYPIGGVAALESMPENPRAQALVAIAGPAVNFVLAGVLTGLGWLLGANVFAPPGSAGLLDTLIGVMVQANLVLGIFNLLPALPMDGGRVFKALLSMRMDARRATDIATRVARVVAIGMGLYGLLGDPGRPMLVVIAIFVWFASAAEARFARAQSQAGRHNAWPTDRHGAQADARLNAWPTDAHRRGAAANQGPSRRVRLEVVQGPFGPVLRVVSLD